LDDGVSDTNVSMPPVRQVNRRTRAITNETYIGAERGEAGAVTLKGDWHTDRQYVEL
jgi:hypothetical protein